MSRLYNQVSQEQGFDYNQGFSHGESYAAFLQREKDKAWEWYEHERDLLNQELREDADATGIIIFDGGLTIYDSIHNPKHRH